MHMHMHMCMCSGERRRKSCAQNNQEGRGDTYGPREGREAEERVELTVADTDRQTKASRPRLAAVDVTRAAAAGVNTATVVAPAVDGASGRTHPLPAHWRRPAAQSTAIDAAGQLSVRPWPPIGPRGPTHLICDLSVPLRTRRMQPLFVCLPL
eukprot:scaffold92619_cov63-Phaeocystis_antarctica.AAC.3